MPDTPETIHRADYRPYPFALEETALAFDIRDGETTVVAELSFARRDGAEGDLVLYGVDVELVSLAVDGRELGGNEYAVSGEALTVFGVPDRCRVQVTTKIVPEDNTAFEGLYKSNDMYCTQCEAEGFRKITYYPDRPDVLTCFTTTISADADRYPVLLSNGNLVADDTVEGHETAFKGSVTDALKRALRSYGEQFGNALYGDGAAGDLAPSLRTTLIDLSARRGFDEAKVRSAVRERTGRDLDELPAATLTPLVEAAARKLREDGLTETPQAA